MTNILPQTSNMNRDAWLLTEETIECYCDIDELLLIRGTSEGIFLLPISLSMRN